MYSSTDILDQAREEDFLGGLYKFDEEREEHFISQFSERFNREPEIHRSDDITLISSDSIKQVEDMLVVFQGYLLQNEKPYETVAELYREKGEDFPEDLEGSFRAAIYDPHKERVVLATDKQGTQYIYYRKEDDKLEFSSHVVPLLGPERSQFNEEYIERFLVHPVWSSRVDITPFEGVEWIEPSRVVSFSNGQIKENTYWAPYFAESRDVSMEEAAEELYKRLKKSAKLHVDASEEVPPVLISGGTDANLIAAILDEVMEEDVKTMTYGWEEKHFRAGRKSAEIFGSEHREIELEYELPGKKWIWAGEMTHHAGFNFPSFKIASKTDAETITSGSAAQSLFIHHTSNIRKLDTYQKLSPIFRAMEKSGINKFMRKHLEGDLYEGLDALSSPYASSFSLNHLTRERELVSQFTDFDTHSVGRKMEKELDKRYNLSNSKDMSENYQYLFLFRRATTFILERFSRNFSVHSIYGYSPVVEYMYSLPSGIKFNKELARTIFREKYPEYYEELSKIDESYTPGGVVKTNIEKNSEEYYERIERLKNRPFVKDEEMLDKLIEDELEDIPAIQPYVMNLYILELFLETFADRENPWEPPQ